MMPRMDSGISLSAGEAEGSQTRKPKPLPLSLLPSLPQAIRAHPRNQLQRRNSPTSSGSFGSFSPISTCFSPVSPLVAPAVQEVPGAPNAGMDGVVVEEEKKLEEEEEMYTPTLRTTSTLEENAARLCLDSSNHLSSVRVRVRNLMSPSLEALSLRL